MSREAVLTIRETEEKAAVIRKESVESARTMIADARKNGEISCETAEKDTRAELKNMLAEMKQKAAVLTEKSRKEATEEAAAMASAAEPKKGIAAKLIIRRLVEKCQ